MQKLQLFFLFYTFFLSLFIIFTGIYFTETAHLLSCSCSHAIRFCFCAFFFFLSLCMWVWYPEHQIDLMLLLSSTRIYMVYFIFVYAVLSVAKKKIAWMLTSPFAFSSIYSVRVRQMTIEWMSTRKKNSLIHIYRANEEKVTVSLSYGIALMLQNVVS